MLSIDRATSLVTEISCTVQSLIGVDEHVKILSYDDLMKKIGYMIYADQNLFINLKASMNNPSFIEKLKRIIVLHGGINSRMRITMQGFSHLIEFCRTFDLPKDDEILRLLSFMVFEIYSKKASNIEGNVVKFSKLHDYIKQADYSDSLCSKEIKGIAFIVVNLRCASYICKHIDALKLRDEVYEVKGQRLISNQFGYFKTQRDGCFDAIAVMHCVTAGQYIVDFARMKISIGKDLYRQLLAEVNCISKVKRKLDDPNSNAKVVFQGITKYGFIKPASDDKMYKLNKLQAALHEVNKRIFTNAGPKLLYNYDKCLTDYIDVSKTNTRSCRELMNMSAIIEHRLLHYFNLGTKCRSPNCTRTGILTDAAIEALLGRADVKLDEVMKLQAEVEDDVDDGAESLHSERTEQERLIQSNSYTYVSSSDKGSTSSKLSGYTRSSSRPKTSNDISSNFIDALHSAVNVNKTSSNSSSMNDW